MHISKELRADIVFLKIFFNNEDILNMHKKELQIGTNWGNEFPGINKAREKELDFVLNNFFKNEKTERNKCEYTPREKVWAFNKSSKMHEGEKTDSLEYDDYTELIKLAEILNDDAWRNELLERECGL